MSQCKQCDTTENLVYSGVDALLLGIDGAETQTYCYPCANQNKKTNQEQEQIMSEKITRYNFKAVMFGNNGDVNLWIENASSEFGYNTKFEIELTPEERAELITVILTATKPGAN
jgi:hypothetical protein